jgi:hypothetical protein
MEEAKVSTYTAYSKQYYLDHKAEVNKKKLPHQAVYREKNREKLRLYFKEYRRKKK